MRPTPLLRHGACRTIEMTPLWLARVLLATMLAQSLAGVWAPQLYRDVDWIRATWYGNDWITLVVACPLLFISATGSRVRAPRWQVLRLGFAGYGTYNYAFYMLGAALNASFLLYIVAFVVAVATLIATLGEVRTRPLSAVFSPWTPVRALAGYMLVVATGLSLVWVGMWARYTFAGGTLPVAPEVFRLVAALDLSFMVPALALGGRLLWRRSDWGFAVASVALVQAALYLLVLSVNAALAIAAGLVPWPGELLVWAPLCVATTIAALVLVACAKASCGRPARTGGTAAIAATSCDECRSRASRP